jgi:hypothetical protein
MEAADGWIDGVEFPATKLEVIDMLRRQALRRRRSSGCRS